MKIARRGLLEEDHWMTCTERELADEDYWMTGTEREFYRMKITERQVLDESFTA